MTSRKDPKFDDGTSARSDFRDAASRPGAGGDRKTAQLCTQVRKALEMAMLADVQDDTLMDLELFSVMPAPDASRLRVVFYSHDPASDLGALRQSLEAARNVLVREAVHAISRRKAPDLVFEVEHAPS